MELVNVYNFDVDYEFENEKISPENADEVYVFSEAGGKRASNMGIKFYARTKREVKKALFGGLPEGVYVTNKDSIEPAIWDDKLVIYSGAEDPSTIVYSLSSEMMEQLIDKINEAIKDERKTICVDLSYARKIRVRDAREISEELLASERDSGRDER